MIYIKKNTISEFTPDEIENGIRSFSLKRNVSLDFNSSQSMISESKYFLAVESSKDIKLTRIRTPIEGFFPKLIVNFPKPFQFTTYRIRFSYLTGLLFFLFLLSSIASTAEAILYSGLSEIDIILPGLLLIFLTLTFLETEITRKKILKAILKTKIQG